MNEKKAASCILVWKQLNVKTNDLGLGKRLQV